MCGADKGHLRHKAFLFHFVNVVIPQKEKKHCKISAHGCFPWNMSVARWGFNAENCRNRGSSSPVCLEREASLLILLGHLHCCPPLYVMRRSFEKLLC